MFLNETVFILGAGASWHYGYPTGEQLVKEVLEKSIRGRDFFLKLATKEPGASMPSVVTARVNNNETEVEQHPKIAKQLANECQLLTDRLLAVNPTVIDYFLGQNPDIREVGRLMIAWAILEHEDYYELTRKRPDFAEFKSFSERDWCRFLLDRLVRDCSTSRALVENRVTFVTFNYDVSLERRIYRGLNAISQFAEGDVREFLGGDRFLHVYGKISDDATKPLDDLPQIKFNSPWTFENFTATHGRDFDPWLKMIDRAYRAAKTLRTIDPTDKELDGQILLRAKDAIAKAAVVYILGFAFDPNNCERLGLEASLCESRSAPKIVCYTNYGDTRNVERAASTLFFETEYPHPGLLQMHRDPKRQFVYEKSSRDCYGALQLDFGTPEFRLIAGSKI